MRTLPRKQPEYKEWKRALYWARPAFEAYYNGSDYAIVVVSEDATTLQNPPPVEAVAASLLLQDALTEKLRQEADSDSSGARLAA